MRARDISSRGSARSKKEAISSKGLKGLANKNRRSAKAVRRARDATQRRVTPNPKGGSYHRHSVHVRTHDQTTIRNAIENVLETLTSFSSSEPWKRSFSTVFLLFNSSRSRFKKSKKIKVNATGVWTGVCLKKYGISELYLSAPVCMIILF